jgi:hypothetical protein
MTARLPSGEQFEISLDDQRGFIANARVVLVDDKRLPE